MMASAEDGEDYGENLALLEYTAKECIYHIHINTCVLMKQRLQ